jgi:hypothetical protein
MTHAMGQRVRHVLNVHGHRGVELEFRLGRRFGTRFVTGISREGWTKIEAALDASPHVAKQPVLATTEKIMADGWKYVVVENAGANGEAPREHWNHKKKIETFEMPDILPDSPWAVRASVSLEKVEIGPAAPQDAPGYVRNKIRTSYLHECWTFDLTRVRSNAPDHADSECEIYEVEVELASTDAFFKYTVDHLLSWGECLVADMIKLAAS